MEAINFIVCLLKVIKYNSNYHESDILKCNSFAVIFVVSNIKKKN